MNYILLGTILVGIISGIIFCLRRYGISTINNVIIKIHKIVKHLQQTIDSIQPCNLVLGIHKIHITLRIIQNCLIIVKAKINNPKLNPVLDEFIKELDHILKITQNVDSTNVQDVKEKISLTLTKIEFNIEEIMRYLNINNKQDIVEINNINVDNIYTLHLLTEQLKNHIVKLEKDNK